MKSLSLKGKLNRLKGHLTLGRSSVSDADIQSGIQQVLEDRKEKIPYLNEWAALDVKPYFYEEQYALVREVSYPLDTNFGRYPFKQLEEVVEQWNDKKAAHPLSAASYQSRDLFFFDTETTGLGGGAGNTIFLLGYAQVQEEQVTVKQFFLPDPSGEIALYQAFLADIQYMKRLVTYNGKAFDWPQVKTRHTLIREWLPKLPSFGHFDLLHASRRLWKNSLPSCRLSVVEKQILGIDRGEDTPGYLAPMLYFDYLQVQDPSIITGIIKHNEWDVLSLISLYIHISQILLHNNTMNHSTQELYEIGRWYEAVGELGEAQQVYEKLVQLEGSYADQGQHALALLYKKAKQYERAGFLWRELAQKVETIEVDLELAKLYEHHYRDYEQALFYASRAFETWKKRASIVRQRSKQEQVEWQKRIERLEFKLMSQS